MHRVAWGEVTRQCYDGSLCRFKEIADKRVSEEQLLKKEEEKETKDAKAESACSPLRRILKLQKSQWDCHSKHCDCNSALRCTLFSPPPVSAANANIRQVPNFDNRFPRDGAHCVNRFVWGWSAGQSVVPCTVL